MPRDTAKLMPPDAICMISVPEAAGLTHRTNKHIRALLKDGYVAGDTSVAPFQLSVSSLCEYYPWLTGAEVRRAVAAQRGWVPPADEEPRPTQKRGSAVEPRRGRGVSGLPRSSGRPSRKIQEALAIFHRAAGIPDDRGR